MSEWTTYRQIRDALNELSEEQLDMTASIYEPEMAEVIPKTCRSVIKTHWTVLWNRINLCLLLVHRRA